MMLRSLNILAFSRLALKLNFANDSFPSYKKVSLYLKKIARPRL